MCCKMINAPSHENECSISEYSISYKSINVCDSLELELTLGLQNHLVLIWRVPFNRNLNWTLDFWGQKFYHSLTCLLIITEFT